MQIRKQEYNLTIGDLIQFPVWEYTLDEEDAPGQNEKTLRPYVTSPPLDRDKGYFLVRAKFVLANRDSLVGYLKPLNKGENKLIPPLLPYDLNPVILTDNGRVTFCYGAFKPDESTLSENYKRLGYKSDNVFPIWFKADIEVRNSVAEGTLQGFMYINNSSQNYFRLKLSDIRVVK